MGIELTRQLVTGTVIMTEDELNILSRHDTLEVRACISEIKTLDGNGHNGENGTQFSNIQEGGKMKTFIGVCCCIFIVSTILISYAAEAPPVKPLKTKIPLTKMRANLVITDVKITPVHPRAKQDMISFEVTVKNAGNGPLPRVCSLALHLSNQDTKPDYSHQIIPWYTNNIPPLAPGAEIKIKSPTITIPYAGKYKLGMVIITEGLQINDENPVNNKKDIYFQAAAADITDLVLDSVAVNPEGRIVLRMHNDGNPIPDQDFDISYVKVKVLDTGMEKNIKLKDMDPAGTLKRGDPLAMPSPFGSGGKNYLNFTWPNTGYDAIKLEPGKAYIVEVTVDYNAQIRDSKRVNNKKTVTLKYNP